MAWGTAWEWMPVRPIRSNHLRKLVGPPTGATAGAGGIGLTMGRGGGGAAADMGTLPREGRLTRVFHTMTFFCAVVVSVSSIFFAQKTMLSCWRHQLRIFHEEAYAILGAGAEDDGEGGPDKATVAPPPQTMTPLVDA